MLLNIVMIGMLCIEILRFVLIDCVDRSISFLTYTTQQRISVIMPYLVWYVRVCVCGGVEGSSHYQSNGPRRAIFKVRQAVLFAQDFGSMYLKQVG